MVTNIGKPTLRNAMEPLLKSKQVGSKMQQKMNTDENRHLSLKEKHCNLINSVLANQITWCASNLKKNIFSYFGADWGPPEKVKYNFLC